MAAPHEVFSFVNKFLSLSLNGENANLSLQCDHGKIAINLQLHLRQCPPPPYSPNPPPRSQPRQHHQPSPSRLRRSTRRAYARAHAQDEKVVKTQKVDPIESSATTEQVAGLDCSKTAEKASLNGVNDVTEKVLQLELVGHATDHLNEPIAEQADPTINSAEVAQEENNDEKLLHTDDERAKIMEVLEECKNSFTLGLRQAVRQGVQEAFMPP